MEEIQACISFMEHFLLQYGDNYVPFHSCPLKDAISEICFATTVRTRQLIALYFHNEDDDFSKMFCSSLEEIKTVLDKTYYIIGWNINNETYHSALCKSLDKSLNFEPAKALIKQKHAALLIIYPIENSVTIFSILHGKTLKIKDLVVALEQIQENFEAELKNEIDLEGLQKNSQTLNDIGSREFQQLMHDRLANRDFDCFEYDELEYLKDKIAFSKYGPPKTEAGYDKKQLKSVAESCKQILKINNVYAEWINQVVVSFIYNCLEPLPAEKLSRANKYQDYNPKTDITPTPVYVVRKCKGSANPCRIFIDHDNRVYESWKDYLEDNKLHRCTMVVPQKGFYKNANDNQIIIERHLSPSCGIGQMVLKGTDIATTLVGLASGGVVIAAMIPTIVIAPIALTVATATGIGVGIYSMIRSAVAIYDRHNHRENMSFANSGARGAYINIIAGSLGFVGAGATTAVTELASKGIDIGQGAQAALSTIRMMNVSVTGVNFANTTIDVVNDWMTEQEKPSYLTFIQLKSSLLFFTNYNFSSITRERDDEIKAAELHEYQELLESNEGRKRKKSLETILYGTEHEHNILPILTIRNNSEIFEILQRNFELFPGNIIFTINNDEIYLNGIMVTLFKFISKQLIELPRTNLRNAQKQVFVVLDDTEFEGLIATNSNFCIAAEILLEGFCDTIVCKLSNLFKKLVVTIDVTIFKTCIAFTRQESLTSILDLLISYLELKVNEKELQYLNEKRSAMQNDNFDEDKFHAQLQVFKEAESRSLVWFEESIEKCVIEELIQYEVSKLAEEIFIYCDNEEKRQRRESNTKKNLFKINCNICEGYYFSKKSK